MSNKVSNEVKWITKPHPHSPVEYITALGGKNATGGDWWARLEQVVQAIDSGNYNFHVMVGIYRAELRTYWHNGKKFVRTTADRTLMDNLLYLPNRGVAA